MESYYEKIKNGGMKLTPRRKAIIRIFIEAGKHLSPEEVWGELQKLFDRCGLPGVYRNLEGLAECGVLTRVQISDRKKHYGLCPIGPDHHHHHVICIECGKVEDIREHGRDESPKIRGYKVLNHFFQVNGICQDCLKSDRPDPIGPDK